MLLLHKVQLVIVKNTDLLRYLLGTVLTFGLNASLPLNDVYDFLFDR